MIYTSEREQTAPTTPGKAEGSEQANEQPNDPQVQGATKQDDDRSGHETAPPTPGKAEGSEAAVKE